VGREVCDEAGPVVYGQTVHQIGPHGEACGLCLVVVWFFFHPNVDRVAARLPVSGNYGREGLGSFMVHLSAPLVGKADTPGEMPGVCVPS